MLVVIFWLAAEAAFAHVPYLETRDFTSDRPFDLKDVTQSKAVHAGLQTGEDVDVYRFEVTSPTRLLVHPLVPVCPAYNTFPYTKDLFGSTRLRIV